MDLATRVPNTTNAMKLKKAAQITAIPGDRTRVETTVAIVATVFAVLAFALVLGLFVWAARKDGQEDRAVQSRLGLRRRTRLGR